MSINPRTKGGNGEREIATKLNDIIWMVRHDLDLPQYPFDKPPVQRNQNQSAVGGDDLVLPLPLSIEIKRQEVLSIPKWWQQCLVSAGDDKTPILLYRQNRKKWRCMMYGWFSYLDAPVACDISFDDFLEWFEQCYRKSLSP